MFGVKAAKRFKDSFGRILLALAENPYMFETVLERTGMRRCAAMSPTLLYEVYEKERLVKVLVLYDVRAKISVLVTTPIPPTRKMHNVTEVPKCVGLIHLIKNYFKMGDLSFNVTIPLDGEGMLGRECLECKKYFKLKPGTGLETNHCHCPYCDYEGNHDSFWTEDQLEYSHSIVMQQAIQKVINPLSEKLNKSFKKLESKTRNSPIKIKVKSTGSDFSFPTKYYSEQELETKVVCDSCGLHFAIYGVFSKCPDCNKTNAFLIYNTSLEVIRKKLNIFSKPEIPEDVIEISLSSIITSSISAFDGLGKELREISSGRLPAKPRNLFQNITLLNEEMGNLISLKHSNFSGLLEWFQVRHIYEHNMGVIDNDFIVKIPGYSNKLGRKYPLTIDALHGFLDMMLELGQIIREELE